MPRDAASLGDILLAARKIGQFVAGVNRDTFLLDERVRSAVSHQLIIIGESARRLSDEFREAHPEIPWSEIVGMRNVLVHMCERVDDEELWRTVASDLPRLAQQVQVALDALEPELDR
jgi:uncharacterized protein with HEPN domain